LSSNDSSICLHLLEIIDTQEIMIEKQSGLIAKLVNETFEKENLITELMRGLVK